MDAVKVKQKKNYFYFNIQDFWKLIARENYYYEFQILLFIAYNFIALTYFVSRTIEILLI